MTLHAVPGVSPVRGLHEAAETLEHVGEERDMEAATRLRARLN